MADDRKGFKLVILDEADMMTTAAQSALRRGETVFPWIFLLVQNARLITVIEQHTKNVRFCILCNYVNKITPAIQSRCTRFRFSPLPEKEIQRKVDEVVEKEGWGYPFTHRLVMLTVASISRPTERRLC